ncbi:hypothetical protein [Fluviicoccus keumensis]|uniref:hypothetical protein n=1 Tax=Fluviicoccus keumensis TaxID=1435465 RepID=UPI00102AAADF|nr:hypothetical protein [Fluviicoccus keumensis]
MRQSQTQTPIPGYALLREFFRKSGQNPDLETLMLFSGSTIFPNSENWSEKCPFCYSRVAGIAGACGSIHLIDLSSPPHHGFT